MVLLWPAKDPEEELDYPLDFSAWVTSPAALDSAVAVVESATKPDGTQENPVTLVIDAAITFASNIVTVWLTGGLKDTTYVLKITATDDNATPFDREVVRRVKIKITEK